MAGNYEKSIYNQLVEVMARLDSVEAKNKREVSQLHGEIAELKEENRVLKKENQLLRDDNARLKSIINNDSSNSSLPPSTDQKAESLPILIAAVQKAEGKPVDREAIRGLP